MRSLRHSSPVILAAAASLLLLTACEAPVQQLPQAEPAAGPAQSEVEASVEQASGPAAESSERWRLVGRSSESAFAVDEKSITRKGDIAEAVILTLIDRPMAVSAGEAGYLTSRYRYDCRNRTDQILNKVAFTVSGEKLLEDPRPEPETPVPPVSTSEQVWSAVCYGFRSGGDSASSIAQMQRAYRKYLETNPVPEPIVPLN